MTSDVTDTVRHVVRSHVDADIELTEETSLVAGGLIDSMSLVDLILDLEEALDAQLEALADSAEILAATTSDLDRWAASLQRLFS